MRKVNDISTQVISGFNYSLPLFEIAWSSWNHLKHFLLLYSDLFVFNISIKPQKLRSETTWSKQKCFSMDERCFWRPQEMN